MMCDVLRTDANYADGFDRDAFERAVQHVMVSKLGYDSMIAQLVLHEYTSHDSWFYTNTLAGINAMTRSPNGDNTYT